MSVHHTNAPNRVSCFPVSNPSRFRFVKKGGTSKGPVSKALVVSPSGKGVMSAASLQTNVRKAKSIYKIDNRQDWTRQRAKYAVQRSKAFVSSRAGGSFVEQRHCLYFHRFASCPQGSKCAFNHCVSKISICTKFARGRSCNASCKLQHKIVDDLMPVCEHFLDGTCMHDNCPFLHIKQSDSTRICQRFNRGMCAMGIQCTMKHMYKRINKPTFGHAKLANHCSSQSKLSTGSATYGLDVDSSLIKVCPKYGEEAPDSINLLPDFIPL